MDPGVSEDSGFWEMCQGGGSVLRPGRKSSGPAGINSGPAGGRTESGVVTFDKIKNKKTKKIKMIRI